MEAALASTEFAERVAVRLKEERARLEAAMLEQLEVEKNALLERKRAAQEAARKAAEDLDRLLEENRHAHPGLQGRGRWLGKSAVMNAARTADVHGGGDAHSPHVTVPLLLCKRNPTPVPSRQKVEEAQMAAARAAEAALGGAPSRSSSGAGAAGLGGPGNQPAGQAQERIPAPAPPAPVRPTPGLVVVDEP